MSTIDRAAAALALTVEALGLLVLGVNRRHGFVSADEPHALPAATRDGLNVGDLVVVHAHQRSRIAVVWALTPSKVSAVYVTPTEVESSAKYGRPVAPNNITARIADTSRLDVPNVVVHGLDVDESDDAQVTPLPGDDRLFELVITRAGEGHLVDEQAPGYGLCGVELGLAATVGLVPASSAGCLACVAAVDEPVEAPAPVGGGTALVTDDAYGVGMLPLAGGSGFLF